MKIPFRAGLPIGLFAACAAGPAARPQSDPTWLSPTAPAREPGLRLAGRR